MLSSNFIRNTHFRLTVILTVIYALSAGFFFLFTYISATKFLFHQTDETLDVEIRSLAELYDGKSIERLAEVIRGRSMRADGGLYLLVRADLTPVVGNLQAWPTAAIDPNGWIDFSYEKPTETGIEFLSGRGRVFKLSGDRYRLLVGRDVESLLSFDGMLIWGLVSTMLVTGVVIVVVGLSFGRYQAQRFANVNEISRDIIEGDLSRRLPLAGTDDEFDQLATNFNAMLEKLDRLMSGMREITDNVAHDMRTPLNRLRSRLETTMMEPTTIEGFQDAVEEAIGDVDGLLRTFRALLSIARVEAGSTARENMDRIEVAPLVENVAELYEPLAEDKEITLKVEVEPAGTVWANRELLSQAIANLIDNAVKYTPDKGTVVISSKLSKLGRPTAEISVADTGPGVPPEERARVLDRFVRLEASRNTPGSGLGLSLVAAVVQLHEGRLVFADSDVSSSDAVPGLKASIRIPTIK